MVQRGRGVFENSVPIFSKKSDAVATGQIDHDPVIHRLPPMEYRRGPGQNDSGAVGLGQIDLVPRINRLEHPGIAAPDGKPQFHLPRILRH